MMWRIARALVLGLMLGSMAGAQTTCINCSGAGNPPTGAAGGDLSGSYPSPRVAGLKSVPFCTGYTPTNGQAIQYTTGSSPNPCYTAATSAGGSNVKVNAGSNLPNVNLNSTTPAADAAMAATLIKVDGSGNTIAEYAKNPCPVTSFGAVCDGTTNDTAHIQAAMDACPVISLPLSTPTSQVQCNVTTLLQNNVALTIMGNQSILNSTATTGNIISAPTLGNGFDSIDLEDLVLDFSSVSGTPNMLELSNEFEVTLNGVYDNGSGPAGYTFIKNATPNGTLVNLTNSHSGGGASSDFGAATSVSLVNSDLGGSSTVAAVGNGFFSVYNSSVGALDVTGKSFANINGALYGTINLTNVRTASIFASMGTGAPPVITGAPVQGLFCYSYSASPNTGNCLTYGIQQLTTIPGVGTAGGVLADALGNLSIGSVATPPVNNAITSATGGTGTGTVTCLTAACTNISGSYSVAGGTFTTGNLLALVWPTTTTAYKCWTSQNGGAATFGIGHSLATATGMTITSGISVLGVTVTVDYGCSKY